VASQRDIKRRIDSVRNTRKITRAMELVASAKLRRAQESIEALRPYARAMRRLMSQAARQSGGGIGSLALLQERPAEGRALVVAITGDRGLAGAFNVNILRTALHVADELRAEGFEDVEFTAVGKKGAGTLRFRRQPIDKVFQGFSADPKFADAEHVLTHVAERFVAGEVNRVVLVYNTFKSVLEQEVTTEQLLPIDRGLVLDDNDEPVEGEAVDRPSGVAFFEPEPEDFLESLLPNYVETTIYRALLESAAAELAARRSAMRNATDNAGEFIDSLTLAMNRARQAAITQEILEVVGGADALE